jgi:hypothetical protein
VFIEVDPTLWYDLLEELREPYAAARRHRAPGKTGESANSKGERSNSEATRARPMATRAPTDSTEAMYDTPATSPTPRVPPRFKILG